jgi:hypothetical protein
MTREWCTAMGDGCGGAPQWCIVVDMGETSARDGLLSTPVDPNGELKSYSGMWVLMAAGIDLGTVGTEGTELALVAAFRRRVGDCGPVSISVEIAISRSVAFFPA